MPSLDALDPRGLRLCLAGPFSAQRAGVTVDLGDVGSRKARTLLKLLALERGHLVSTERIIELLWGAEPPTQPHENVATLVSRLRKALGSQIIVGGRGGYQLAEAPIVVVDLDEAVELVSEAERRLSAVHLALAVTAADRAVEILARGPVLDDDSELLPHGDDEARRLLALQRARYAGAAAALGADDVAAALRYAEAAVADDRIDETAHRLLMAAHQAAGEPARAIAVYTQLRDVLDAELGVEPSPATRDLYVAILREQDARPAVAVEAGRVPQSNGPRLVGRDAETIKLEAAWTAASSGRPELVLLVGQAGIGKSRLAIETAVVAAATGGTVLHARCYETERALFLQPVIEALRPALERLSPADLQRVAGDNAATLAGLVPSALGTSRTTAVPRGDVELERRRLFDAVTDTVARLADRAPVLLVLDDLQNAGRTTIELLHYMARRLSGARVLLLGVVRREEGHDAVAALSAVSTVVDVNALSHAAVADLAGAFGQAHLVDHILRQTGGHTLYVIETLAALTSGQSGLPASLQVAVVDRVSRLGADVETLLRAAAVLGATLHVEHLAAVLATTTPLVLDRCGRAYSAGLLVVAEREYEFANDLVREVLYESTPEPTRRAWHLHAADLLAGQPEAMAGHAAAAGDEARAARAWLLAAQEAYRLFAAADAEALATMAINSATLASDLEIAARAHVLRGRAREITADFAAAFSDLETAVALARQSGDQRTEMIALRQLGGDVPVALGLSVAPSIAHLERGLLLAEGLGDRLAEVDLLARLAVISANRLLFAESLDYARRAVAIARRVGDDEVLAAALDGLKTGWAYLGEVDELDTVVAELEPLLRRRGDWFLLHWAVFESAFSPIARGQWDDAVQRIEAAADMNSRHGYHAYQAWYDAHLGWVERLRGDLDRALFYGRRAVHAAGVEHPWWQVAANSMLATTLLEVGDTAEAVGLLEVARGAAQQDGSQAYRLRCLAPLAEATGARDVLLEATALLVQISAPSGCAWFWGGDAYLSVARAWLAAGEPAQARVALAPLLGAAARVPWTATLDAALLLDAKAAVAAGSLST